MRSRFHPAPILVLVLLVFLAGCATPARPVIKRGADPLTGMPVVSSEATAPEVTGTGGEAQADAAPDPFAPRLTPGTGRVINERVASAPPPSLDMPGEATFNFEGEPVHAVVKVILGDLLQQNYVIAPGVQGQVTLATPRPVNAAQALGLLEMVLGWNNARLVYSGGRYNIVPSDQALAGNVAARTGAPSSARGFEVRTVPLKYVSATEMEKILKPYARPNAIVNVDNSRDVITVGGSRAELENYLRTIEVFDVDWLSGMSVGVFPLQSGRATRVVADLEKVFGNDSKTPSAGMFRFMPLEGANAV
ncbi:MAG TPA: secretin N-terminal domain-containing protein, partial [Arenimonas sp.]|nr:secretin N-terminal domain-containing protein [Arenimonas sp.]